MRKLMLCGLALLGATHCGDSATPDASIGATASCTNVGTRSEGWYTDVASAACGDPPVDRLIQWARCSP